MTGEIGVLANADTDRTGNRCFVTMEFESKRYIATVPFSDVTFCWLIARTLKNRVGMPIKDIGDLDLSYTRRSPMRWFEQAASRHASIHAGLDSKGSWRLSSKWNASRSILPLMIPEGEACAELVFF